MSVDSVIKLSRVHEPLQQRSRKTLERVLNAFVELLAKKPFEEITMAELARRSRIAVTSIYARFENKQALVLAAHERHRDEMIREIDQLLDPVRWGAASLPESSYTRLWPESLPIGARACRCCARLC